LAGAATLAFTMALTLAVPAPALAQPHDGGHRHGRHGPGAEGFGPMMGLSDRALDHVKATPEQRTQIRQILQSARTDLQAQKEAGRALREQARQLFSQPTVDARAAEDLRQRMLAQHDQRSKRMMQAMLDASRVLTPEQRRQMADAMGKRRDMMERHHRERRALEAPKS
jgi:Spy/CpxP family protein refolding chaperone